MKPAKKQKCIYVIGSLANREIPTIGNEIRKLGFEAFDQWWAPGPLADSYWRHYTKLRGQSFKEALADYAGRHIFEFDRHHLDRSSAVVMVCPAGRSGHMEFGYAIGKGKKGFILFDGEPKKYDVMYGFATKVFFSREEFFEYLKNYNQ
jgi:hypothetical protein